MNKKLTILACGVLGLLSSCYTYDFEQEQYRKEINLLQNNNGIYDRQVVDMKSEYTDEGAYFYIVAGLSGSRPSTEDYTVSLVKSDSLFKAFNKSQYDIETDRYAKLLPEECYEEPTLVQSIKAGETKTMFKFKVKNIDKLSPDSIYMLNYEIDPSGSASYNKKKNHVLFRLHWKNDYANTQANVSYQYNSTTVTTPATTAGGTALVRRPTNNLVAFPLSHNSVRFLAGDETYGNYTKALPHINQKSIIVEVGDQLPENPLARYVTIKPYKDEEIEVVQLTPIGEYDNTFLLNELNVVAGGNSTYFKEFRLHYKYRLLKVRQSNGTYAPGPFKTVKAKLRADYNPRRELL